MPNFYAKAALFAAHHRRNLTGITAALTAAVILTGVAVRYDRGAPVGPATTAGTAPATQTTVQTAPETSSPTTGVPESTATTTTTLPGVTAPLTGQTVAPYAGHGALLVKIDNVGPARPQRGLSQADIVFVEQVEGGVTRYAAVFHSKTPEVIGPVRSGRETDIGILSWLSRPAMAYSGASVGVEAVLSKAQDDGKVTLVGASAHGGAYFRSGDRQAPHNLYLSSAATVQARRDSDPAPVFTYYPRAGAGAGAGAGAVPVGCVDVSYPASRVRWTFDDGTGLWRRTQDGTVVVDADTTAPVGEANVVVAEVSYKTSPANGNSPMAVLTGGGRVWVASGATWREGRWDTSNGKLRLTDRSGADMALAPGPSFVELSPQAPQTC